jgi:hypothetical protein
VSVTRRAFLDTSGMGAGAASASRWHAAAFVGRRRIAGLPLVAGVNLVESCVGRIAIATPSDHQLNCMRCRYSSIRGPLSIQSNARAAGNRLLALELARGAEAAIVMNRDWARCPPSGGTHRIEAG